MPPELFLIFFEAIMGTNLTEDELIINVADNGLLSKGEIGCALSHLSIYKDFLSTKENHAFIFEDDILLDSEFTVNIPILKKFINTQTRPTVLLLYKSSPRIRLYRGFSASPYIRIPFGASGAHGYLINRAGAESILKIQTPLKIPIDIWSFYVKLNELRLYCLDQNLVHLNPSYADISLISSIETRYRGLHKKEIQQKKTAHYNNLYRQKKFSDKCLIEILRIQRHIQIFLSKL